MAFTTTTNFGLYAPTPGTAEDVDLTALNGNWAKLDDLARAVPCTSGTRPSTPFAGQVIFETDTLKLRMRNTANSAWLTVASSVAEITSITRPTPPNTGGGMLQWETDTYRLIMRTAADTGWRTVNQVPIVNNTSDITAPQNGQVVLSLTGFGLYLYKSSASAWIPLSHDQYYTFRLGTNTSVSNAAWTAIPFATAGEGSLAGISTSDNIQFTFNEPGVWSVSVMLGTNANQGFIGALIRGTVNDPFSATNSETYAMQSAPAIQTVAGVSLAADIRVATGGTRTVRCSAISTSAAFNLTNSGPMKPRISFRWSPL